MPQERKELSLLDTIQDLKRRMPYEPFRIVLTSGDKYLIEDGENLIVMKSQVFYVFPRSDKFVFMRINQLVAVEQFEQKSSVKKRKSA